MSEFKHLKLVLVFVKNIKLGKVKTRLAKSIGDEATFEIYKELVQLTENVTEKLTNCDVNIYFSDVIIETKWKNQQKFVQIEGDLGDKMKNAFEKGFEMGYRSIIGIGSDLPDLTSEIIENGFKTLQKAETVFGPSEDGGYYLIGMNSLQSSVFKNKPWSTDTLLEVTVRELEQNNITYQLLQELNDIDTIEDLKKSTLADKFRNYIK